MMLLEQDQWRSPPVLTSLQVECAAILFDRWIAYICFATGTLSSFLLFFVMGHPQIVIAMQLALQRFIFGIEKP